MKKKFITAVFLMIGGFLIFGVLTGFKSFEQKPWPVPAAANSKRNPVPSDAQTIATGKTLYSIHCKSCHGAKGLGDGTKASQLKTESGNFSKADFQSQTDGALFYKTSEGRDDMPSFKKKIPDEDDRWSLVNFMRTLKK